MPQERAQQMNDNPKNNGGAIYAMLWAAGFGAVIIAAVYIMLHGVMGW